MARLKKRDIDNARPDPGKTWRLWDDNPRGFGLYVKPSGVKSFFIQYVSPLTSKKRRYTIGQYGRLTLDEARAIGRELLTRVAKGEDPLASRVKERDEARSRANTVSELCDDYIRDAHTGLVTYRGKPKKQSTLATDQGRIERHIKPLIGSKSVIEITKKDIEKLMHDIRLGKTAIDIKTGTRGRAIVTGGAGTASRTVGLLGSIFSYAVNQGVRPDNPVRGVTRPNDGKRDRILSPEEYGRLGEALRELESKGANKTALRAYEVLALTGCRRSEIFNLRRSEIIAHQKCLRLGDTKTGAQSRVVGSRAMELLLYPSFDDESHFVFPATRGAGCLTDVKPFRAACTKAVLDGVSLHTLRHSFASVALELEYSELTIAGLLGHRIHSVTARYAHHVDQALVAAADRISTVIARRMAGEMDSGADVIPLRGERS